MNRSTRPSTGVRSLDGDVLARVRARRAVRLGLLHRCKLSIPTPLRTRATVVFCNESGPSVVFDLGGSDSVHAVDGG